MLPLFSGQFSLKYPCFKQNFLVKINFSLIIPYVVLARCNTATATAFNFLNFL